jgi:hypothetical protein
MAYEARREQFFKKRHGRAALLAGGIIRRLALEELGIEPALSGPTDSPYYSYIITTDSGQTFVDDALSVAEMDLICGVYYVYSDDGTKLDQYFICTLNDHLLSKAKKRLVVVAETVGLEEEWRSTCWILDAGV